METTKEIKMVTLFRRCEKVYTHLDGFHATKTSVLVTDVFVGLPAIASAQNRSTRPPSLGSYGG